MISKKRMSNAIRALTIDAVSKANSGHPGMPLGMADVATVLFTEFLNFNPKDPDWANRDRFILSAGHGSMLLYSLLYLTGYAEYTLEEIKKFRQLHSKTPGHPEYGAGKGIENTSGPLGQGLGIGVGIALAERIMNARFGDSLINHYTYVLAGDGCLMEGLSHEAASFAGHMGLNKLILLFDDNKISIDGNISLTTSDDVQKKFESYNWNVIKADGHDFPSITNAIHQARSSLKPSIICCETIIGKFMPAQGTEKTHSGGLSELERKEFKELIEYPIEDFSLPDDVLKSWHSVAPEKSYVEWQQNFDSLPTEKKLAFTNAIKPNTPNEIFSKLKSDSTGINSEATRQSSGRVIKALTDMLKEMIGGSCDLTSSNNVVPALSSPISKNNYSGNFIHYGVREHFMGACMNGLALHSGLIPYGGTFFVFSDYMRPAIRMSALMGLQVIYIMTHDSIGVGEDGPTHQPIEHLDSLRLMPNLYVFRPCDYIETIECWQIALQMKDAPSLIVLSRQKTNFFERTVPHENLSSKGGYKILEAEGKTIFSLISTGYEVSICVSARKALQKLGYPTEVISVPCLELLSEEDATDLIDPDSIKIIIESGTGLVLRSRFGVQSKDCFTINAFGASAPYEELYRHFNLTDEAIVAHCIKIMSKHAQRN